MSYLTLTYYKQLCPVMPFSADLLPTALQEFVYDEADRMPAPCHLLRYLF